MFISGKDTENFHKIIHRGTGRTARPHTLVVIVDAAGVAAVDFVASSREFLAAHWTNPFHTAKETPFCHLFKTLNIGM